MSLTIIRGLPGSGKSTLAKALRIAYGHLTTVHFEADQFFVVDGKYQFDGMRIGEAHAWCQTEVDNALFYKQDVIVSNTFTTHKELKPYFEMAKKYKVNVQVILCQGNFGSIHEVPEHVIHNMRQRFAYDLTSLFEDLKG